ncbi:MAG: DHHA1 domain-containing protein [Candidatus Pacearchaeota archaeon]|nr:DHHA1 domain-containing protein [Candidatus Pacearchaeota archaeon]
MLTENQLQEIREHLERSQNPIFFFDNDVDGLTSFLLLRRWLGRGKGIAIKSFPELQEHYAKRISELNGDYVFILDKPVVARAFFEETLKMNVPVVWIDHHDVTIDITENVSYYNNVPDNKPVSYICQKIAGRKEDEWLALLGCIGDSFIPEFSSNVEKQYPEYWRKVKTAFEGLYNTRFGEIIMMLNFGLKDKTSNVLKMIRLLLEAKSPNDIIEENSKTSSLRKRFLVIKKKYSKLLEKAMKNTSNKLIYFQYSGDLSLSADLANELYYNFPEKTIVVAYIKGTKTNLSLRGKTARKLTLKAIEGLDASGGGHEEATGARINSNDLPKFIEKIEGMIG